MPRKNRRKNKNKVKKVSDGKTVCLVMIVKNESKVIKRAFDSVHKYIDYWVICDTGSTDGTQKIIKDYFKEKNIPGELHEHKWKNFGHNRSLAVKNAKGKADYGILMDADFIFVIKDPDFKKKLNTRGGHMVGYEGSLDFRQNLFIDLSLDWYYKGVTHEHITVDKKVPMNVIDYFKFTHKADGGSRSDKYERDVRMLVQGLKDEPNNQRYMFYLGQSYFCTKDYKNSLKYYQMRIDKGGWPEEVYFSMYRVGLCKLRMNMDFNEFRKDLFNAYKFRPCRLESLYTLCEYCLLNKMYDIGFQYALNAIDNKYPNRDVLFIKKEIHDYYFWLVFGLLALHCKKIDITFNIFNKLISTNKVLPREMEKFKQVYRTCLIAKKDLSRHEVNTGNKVAIILVNYNMKEKTEKIIKHLEKTIKQPYDLITVDNGSDEKEKINATINLKNNIHITNGILVALNYADTLETFNKEKYFGYSIIDSNIEFVNDDDILTSMVNTMKNDINIVGISPTLTQDSKTTWNIFKQDKNKEKENVYFIQDQFSLYRASWFNKNRYTSELKYGWGIDIETGYRAYRDHKKMLIDNSLVLKYNDSKNYSKKSNKEKGDDMNLYFIKKYGTDYSKVIYKNVLNKSDYTKDESKGKNKDVSNMVKIDTSKQVVNFNNTGPFKSLLNNSDSKIINNKFVIIIPSYNNKKWYSRNLDSVLSQKYKNYRVIYVDDCSSDNTYKLVNKYIKEKKTNKIQLFKQKKRGRQCLAKYVASHMCDDDEIIVILDGDDWLYDKDVLTKLNIVYNKKDVWVTYGSFSEYENGVIKKTRYSMNKPHQHYTIITNNYRKAKWLSSHLRTYRASVMKSVPIDYLIDHNGDFFKTSNDCAEMYSVLELSGGRHKCIEDILYCYNIDNSNSHETSWINSTKYKDMHEYRMKTLKQIRGMNKLNPLSTLPVNNYESKNNFAFVVKINKVEDIDNLIEKLKNILPNIKLEGSVKEVNKLIKKHNIKDTDLNVKYLVYLDKNIKSIININKYIKYLNQTKLSTFYLEPNLENINYNYLEFNNSNNNIVIFRKKINSYNRIINIKYNKDIYLGNI
jgi:glycosyltransferase involved in cell wall biosynthesis